MKQATLFDGMRLTLEQAVEQSLDSLRYYGERYRHWALAYSGGKDSSAAVTFVAWAIRTGQIPAPESLTVLYADTRMELPPLQRTALDLLATLREQGFQARVVWPPFDVRFLVYMLAMASPRPPIGFAGVHSRSRLSRCWRRWRLCARSTASC